MTTNNEITLQDKNRDALPVRTDKQKAFLVALAGEAKGDLRTAMSLAGYSKSTRISEVVGALREDVLEIAEHILSMSAVKAALAYGEVIDTPNAFGASVKVAAANQILDRVGMTKRETGTPQVQVGTIFILPPKN